MAKGIWQRRGDVAIPIGAESIEHLRSVPDGDEFLADTRTPRNLKQLKMFWALVELVADTTDQPKETIKRSLAIELGFIEVWTDMQGGEHIHAKSIAVESMAQAVWKDFLDSAIKVIGRWLGSAPADVRRRFEQIIADKRYEGYMR